MSRFLDDANEIFEAASAVVDASPALTILIHPRGGIHIVDGAESPIESLQAQHGCGTAFRVTRQAGSVRVEGRNGMSRCVLEKRPESHGAVAAAANLGLFYDRPVYSVAGCLAIS